MSTAKTVCKMPRAGAVLDDCLYLVVCGHELPCPFHVSLPSAPSLPGDVEGKAAPTAPLASTVVRGAQQAATGLGQVDPLLRTPRQFLLEAQVLVDRGAALVAAGKDDGACLEVAQALIRCATRMMTHGWTLDGRVQ